MPLWIQEMDARPYLISVTNAIDSDTDYGWMPQYNIYNKPHQVAKIVDIIVQN